MLSPPKMGVDVAACRFDVELRQRRVVGTGAGDQHVVDRRGQLVEESPEPFEVGGIEGGDAGPELEADAAEALRVARGEDHVGPLGAGAPPELPPITTTVCPASSGLALMPSPPVPSPGAHLTSTTSGFPVATTYVASSAALPLSTFLAAWTVPAGMNKTSPALSVTGGLPSTSYSSKPSMT